MNSIQQISFIFFGLLLFSSCEDVIVLDLEEAEPRLVIEGTIDAGAQEAQVWLSRTNAFYEAASSQIVDGAVVRLVNPFGEGYELVQEADGAYRYSDLAVEPGEQYRLEVTVDEVVYTALAEVPFPVVLDSLNQEEISFPFANEEEPSFQVFANWTDTPNRINYYRIKAFVDGEELPDNYTLLNDELSDGNPLVIPIREAFEAGSLVRIELRSVDAAYYDYFQKLSTILAQGANSATPFNPKGNFDQDVLGYFGIYHISALAIQL